MDYRVCYFDDRTDEWIPHYENSYLESSEYLKSCQELNIETTDAVEHWNGESWVKVTDTELVEIWSQLVKTIGTEKFLSLPEDVKTILKRTNDLEAKVKMFELIAKTLGIEI